MGLHEAAAELRGGGPARRAGVAIAPRRLAVRRGAGGGVRGEKQHSARSGVQGVLKSVYVLSILFFRVRRSTIGIPGLSRLLEVAFTCFREFQGILIVFWSVFQIGVFLVLRPSPIARSKAKATATVVAFGGTWSGARGHLAVEPTRATHALLTRFWVNKQCQIHVQ